MWVFGNEEFNHIVDNNWFGVIDLHNNKPKVFGHFSNFTQAYNIYSRRMDITDVGIFRDQISHIDHIVNGDEKYKFITELRNNPIFTLSEFARFIFIVRDIYNRGRFHMPCSYWAGKEIKSHPGNHLSFTSQMLGLDIRTLITIPNALKTQFDQTFKYDVVTRFETIDHMDEYFPEYLAWIQDGEIEFPAVTVTAHEWDIVDTTGFLLWPNISRTREWAEQQWWWDWLPDVLEHPEKINDMVEVKVRYLDQRLLFANLVGFALNTDRCIEDGKFRLKYPQHTSNYDEYITKFKPSSTRQYYGNKHTSCENNLK